MNYTTDDYKQELIVKAWEQVINDCKSIEELLRQPIDWKIACYSPDEMTKERKQHLLNVYNAKLKELKDKGANYRFNARLHEIINKI